MKRFVKLRNTIMFLLKMLVVVTLTTSFLGVWKTYYSEASISGSGNVIILLVYVGVFVIFATLYDGFKVGINRVHELVYSLTLASVFTNTLLYLILCLVASQMQNPIPMIVLLVAQIIMLIAFISSHLIRPTEL